MNGNILDQIVTQKRIEIENARPVAMRENWRERAIESPSPPSFLDAIARPGRIRVIAEIKKASPSAGVLRENFDPVAIAADYERNSADCLSVLTDGPYFQGSIDHLRAVHAAVRLPLLRKDFILDPIQVYEARLAGASAVLLIAECLNPSQLGELVERIHSIGMTALVELFDRENLPAVLDSGARLIGINNRDLRNFKTDLGHTLDLLPQIPRDRIVVSESGIRTRDDVRRLHEAGVSAILVGEAFMRADSPGEKLAELLGARSERG
jgi:indole-3-glycerol phosphate synthase